MKDVDGSNVTAGMWAMGIAAVLCGVLVVLWILSL